MKPKSRLIKVYYYQDIEKYFKDTYNIDLHNTNNCIRTDTFDTACKLHGFKGYDDFREQNELFFINHVKDNSIKEIDRVRSDTSLEWNKIASELHKTRLELIEKEGWPFDFSSSVLFGTDEESSRDMYCLERDISSLIEQEKEDKRKDRYHYEEHIRIHNIIFKDLAEEGDDEILIML